VSSRELDFSALDEVSAVQHCRGCRLERLASEREADPEIGLLEYVEKVVEALFMTTVISTLLKDRLIIGRRIACLAICIAYVTSTGK
jgi:hypothetical protein